MEQQSQGVQLKKLKIINTVHQKGIDFRPNLDNRCDKMKEATKEAMDNLSANYGVLGDNLKESQKSLTREIIFLKSKLADFKFNCARKSEATDN